MPTISVDVTNNQAQRISAAFGPIPPELEGMTQQQWVAYNIKRILKERVKDYEARLDSNTAFDAARAKVDTDFGGF